jgi:hypothetical protein
MICSILFNTPSLIIAFFLLLLILLFYVLGTIVGYHQKIKNPDAKSDGVGPLEGALLGLLALLLSFTFSMTSSRYDKRIQLAINEANDISTAILRADLYPDSIRTAFRNDFKLYIEARIAYDNAGNSNESIDKYLAEAETVSARIWSTAANAAKASNLAMPHSVMIPALNSMIDVVTSREAARIARVPDLIMWLLIILNLLGSFTIGYSKNVKKRDWIILSIYALMTVATIFTILDLDRPNRGIITTKSWSDKIVDLRKMF